MGVRGLRTDDKSYEKARDGTIYWTLSLYIEPDKVAQAAGLEKRSRIRPEDFGALQRRHFPSLALANAIDPLMNDIADRETQGQVQEFLLAAIDDAGAKYENLTDADAAVRGYRDLIFKLPPSISWTTEGVEFHAHPEGLDDDRAVRLRRFWLSHNNGAISYHMSFSHYYGDDPDILAAGGPSRYEPSTYYFLSLLQKLAAPKEYALETSRENPDPSADVFKGETGIAPLDNIKVLNAVAGPTDGSGEQPEGETFWPFVWKTFAADAEVLFETLDKGPNRRFKATDGVDSVLDMVPFIEVPGLKMPKSRFMFMLQDKRFFDRLMPLDPRTKEAVSRKQMVQEGCFDAYQNRIKALMKPASGPPPRSVHLGHNTKDSESAGEAGADYWDWVRDRHDYEEALREGFFARQKRGIPEDQLDSENASHWDPIQPSAADGAERGPLTPLDDLVAAMRSGECFQRYRFGEGKAGSPARVACSPPIRHHIPAFSPGRPDCLEYLFLAGFNQNIIDFMNQDTSEILDSIDPIYPDSEDQSSDRFFVRYANHRAMITYVPKSRSLETGNDYIGACPYAFLIHAMALHNEFLARGHEHKTMARIARIEALVDEDAKPDDPRIVALAEDPTEKLIGDDELSQAEYAINQAKLKEFNQYERFRHANPFRYDTERAVFEKLEQLRGVSRKKAALTLAVKSLEDHASDLSRRKQKKVDDDAAARGVWLNILLGMTGFFGAGQMFYWIGEKAAGPSAGGPPSPLRLATPFGSRAPNVETGNWILAGTEVVMMVTLALFIGLLGYIIWDSRKEIARIFRIRSAQSANANSVGPNMSPPQSD